MSNPVCPACHGSAVHPDQFSAGHNVCACGHRAPVAEFHPDPSGNPFEFMNRISGQTLFSQSMIDYAEQLVPLERGEYNRLFMQEPFPLTPEGAEWDDKTGTYKPARKSVSIFDTPVPSRAPVKHWSDN